MFTSSYAVYLISSGIIMGPQGPQLRGPRQKGAQKGPIFKPYRARWGIGGPFLRSCGGPKFEVTPLLISSAAGNYILSDAPNTHYFITIITII